MRNVLALFIILMSLFFVTERGGASATFEIEEISIEEISIPSAVVK